MIAVLNIRRNYHRGDHCSLRGGRIHDLDRFIEISLSRLADNLFSVSLSLSSLLIASVSKNHSFVLSTDDHYTSLYGIILGACQHFYDLEHLISLRYGPLAIEYHRIGFTCLVSMNSRSRTCRRMGIPWQAIHHHYRSILADRHLHAPCSNALHNEVSAGHPLSLSLFRQIVLLISIRSSYHCLDSSSSAAWTHSESIGTSRSVDVSKANTRMARAFATSDRTAWER